VLPSPANSHDSGIDDDEHTWLKNIRPFTPLVGQRSYGALTVLSCTPPCPAPSKLITMFWLLTVLVYASDCRSTLYTRYNRGGATVYAVKSTF
jgi:hypothetical protein